MTEWIHGKWLPLYTSTRLKKSKCLIFYLFLLFLNAVLNSKTKNKWLPRKNSVKAYLIPTDLYMSNSNFNYFYLILLHWIKEQFSLHELGEILSFSEEYVALGDLTI